MYKKINELTDIERIHPMGIGGSGMSALALLLSGFGFKVSGCDLSRSDYFPELEKKGIEWALGHSAGHIGHFSPQLVVYSSAVNPGHEELLAARAEGATTAGRGRVLSWLFNAHCGIGVAGTHGKTTTSSMLALILARGGADPTLAIGAEVCDLGTNARVGQGDFFVAEIDESDGSFEFFRPGVTVVTNVDWDHVNYFPTREAVVEAFVRFARGRKPETPLVVCAEDEGIQSMLHILKDQAPQDISNVVTCGWGRAWNWGACDVVRKKGGGVVFAVVHDGKDMGRMKLSVSGDHNIMNALEACAAAFLAGIPFNVITDTLAEFRGAVRRLQPVGSKGRVEVLDDYGHHPTEIAATLSALRDIYPDRRLVVVFQPHRFTRTSAFYREIATALSAADVTLLLPVYSAGEKAVSEISSQDIFDIMEENGRSCVLCRDEADALSRLDQLLNGDDVLLTLGAGSVSGLGGAWLKKESRVS